MLLFQYPRRIILVNGKYKAGIARRIVKQIFDANFILQIIGNESANLRECFFFALAQNQAAVKKNCKLVGDGVERRGARVCIGDRDGGFAQKRVGGQTTVQFADSRNNVCHFIHRVVAEIMMRRVCGTSIRCDFEFKPSFVSAINLHLGRFTNHHKIGTHLWVGNDERIGRNAVAPFFHVPEIVRSETVEQAQIARERQTVHHAGRRTFFIARAARVQNIIFHFADERVPLPRTALANADGVNV